MPCRRYARGLKLGGGQADVRIQTARRAGRKIHGNWGEAAAWVRASQALQLGIHPRKQLWIQRAKIGAGGGARIGGGGGGCRGAAQKKPITRKALADQMRADPLPSCLDQAAGSLTREQQAA